MLDDTSDPLALARAAQHKAIRKRRRAMRGRSTATAAAPSQTPGFSPTQRVGRRAEEQAVEHVQATGIRVLERNLSCRAGEIDLICLDGDVLVFIEVRQRHNARFGGAAASVHHAKQQRLGRAAAYFLPRLARRYFRGHTPRCRFDVIAIDGTQLTWLRGVFETGR